MKRVRPLLALALFALCLTLSPGLNAAAATADLFISEYVEGSSLNKAVEIYNGTGAAVDLAADGYALEVYFNGNTNVGTTITLSGVVADGDVFVVADDGADAAVLAVTDQITTSSLWNGDDALVLVKNGAVVDSFGQVGTDPGSEWPGGGANDTLRRLDSVCAGDMDPADAFDASVEWASFASDTFDGLGSHTANCGSAAPDAVLNEIIINTPSTDWEFVEISGAAGTDLSSLTFLEIDRFGAVDGLISFAGQTIPASGYFTAASPAAEAQYGFTADLGFADNFLTNNTSSYLLVQNFTGTTGDDLDTNDDGTFDGTHWDAVVSEVAALEAVGETTYASPVIGPDGTFMPAGVYRCDADWFMHDFGSVDVDGTPGADNALCGGGGPSATILINEVDADTAGTDTLEFVELFDGGAGNTPLDGFLLVFFNGNGDTSYAAYDLDGFSTDANGYFLLGNTDVSPTPAIIFGSNGLQNGADAVALYADDGANFPNGTAVTTTNLLDALVYDTNDSDDTELLALLNAGQPQINEDGAGDKDNHSNQRCPNGSGGALNTDTYAQFAPSPGAANSCGAPPAGEDEILLTELVVTPTSGEFIEIFNPGSGPVDLSNYYLTDATFAGGGTYYYNIVTGSNAGGGGFGDFHARFPDGATIAAGEYQTIALTGSADFLAAYGIAPTYELVDDSSADGEQLMREALPGAINNQGGLTNSGEVVVLYLWDGQSDLVTDVDYAVWGDKDEAVDKTGVTIDGPDADTDVSTYLPDTAIAAQDVIAAGAHSSGTSWQRDDLAEGTELTSGGNGVNGEDETSENLSVTWCENSPTPGAASDCEVVPPAQDAKIHEVQGSGASVAITTPVNVSAIVVGDFQLDNQLDGFFIQEEDADADADPNTSEGIFVYCGGCAVDVAVGDLVQVTGTPTDFFDMSQIDVTDAGGAVNVVSSGNALPTPAVVDLPAAGSTTAESTFENIEGMLVTFSDELFVSEYFQLARFGQLVLTADARPAQFTDANEPGVAEYAAFLEDLSSKRIILDDDDNIQNSPLNFSDPTLDDPYFWPQPGLTDMNFVRGGDSISGLTGVMHWSFAGFSGTDAWRVRPVTEAFNYDFTTNNERMAAPADTGGSFTVASFNVLNYFTTIDSRGADSLAELDRQREKIAAAICGMDADVVGLIEIENNGSVALNDLLNGANGVNANCGPYEFIDTGVIGTDQIAVAFIYKPATAAPVGDFAVLDSSVDARFIDTKNRPALAQTFQDTTTGGIVTVVVNHLKSKGSPCDDVGDPDLNDGQANCNLTRTAAAEAMVDWLATDPTGSGDPDFLIIGDLNAYRNEDPIDALEEGADDTAGTTDDYTDLLDSFLGNTAYSYVFDGQVGYLDHALANNDLLSQVAGVTVWHINADEIPLFDYNDEIRDAGEANFERESTATDIYEPDAYRASDHDPVIIGLDMCDTFAPEMTVAVTPDTLWPPFHQLVLVRATVTVTDNADPNPTFELVSVTSDEPQRGPGWFFWSRDIIILNDTTFLLRAERLPWGDGRTYTITYEATDNCGNTTVESATVEVPKRFRPWWGFKGK